MDSANTSLFERVSNSIRELSSAAQDLNAVSGELGKAVAAIDTVLQSLNIGIETWTRIDGGRDPNGESYWYRQIGYAKINGKWGIAIRNASGDGNRPDDDDCDDWLFSDAPRAYRVQGAGKIPELIEDLIRNTRETTTKIKITTDEVNNLATVIAQAAKNDKGKTSGAHVSLSESIASPRPVPIPPSFPTFIPPPPPPPPPVKPAGSVSVGSVVGVSLHINPPGGAKKPKGGK
jgi:predicted RNA-binding protein YlqC (UPF0109 family)